MVRDSINVNVVTMLRIDEYRYSGTCQRCNRTDSSSRRTCRFLKTADRQERLFLSERAEFKPGVAIRGGVPIIFPQFAALGPLPKHGPRTLAWQFNAADAHPHCNIHSDLFARNTGGLALRFAAIYQVKLDKDQLNMQLSVKNEDEKQFSFMAALHTYLRVADINGVSIHGLRLLIAIPPMAMLSTLNQMIRLPLQVTKLIVLIFQHHHPLL